MFDVHALDVQLTKAAAWAMFAEALAFAIGMLVLYFVLKSAIRDGINESRMGRENRTSQRAQVPEAKDAPPMTADR